MNAFDWIIDIALIGIVYRQVKGGQLTLSSVKLPVIILVIAGFNYFDGFSTSGNDLVLTVVVMAAGALFGVIGGLTTKVWRQDDGKIFSRAGVVAATAWIVGMGIRDGLDIYSNTHRGCGPLSFLGSPLDYKRQCMVNSLFLDGCCPSHGSCWHSAISTHSFGERVGTSGGF
jgi:hypothetical protein